MAFQTGCLQLLSINQAVFFWSIEICSQDTTHMAISGANQDGLKSALEEKMLSAQEYGKYLLAFLK